MAPKMTSEPLKRLIRVASFNWSLRQLEKSPIPLAELSLSQLSRAREGQFGQSRTRELRNSAWIRNPSILSQRCSVCVFVRVNDPAAAIARNCI